MGKLKVVKTGPLTTIQDFGRYGYRKYGIPQSGAMDMKMMIVVNRALGNSIEYPVIEFALMGLKLECIETTRISVSGASIKINGEQTQESSFTLKEGDLLEISAPQYVYGYLGLGGKIKANEDFGSFSTYSIAGFGGHEGRALKKGDVISSYKSQKIADSLIEIENNSKPDIIRVLIGPETSILNEPIGAKSFKISSSSNRMGIRLEGESYDNNFKEIASSPVLPGTVQLPPSGKPIVLMNDCQTTGGYPRIAQVIREDLGKLAQVRPGKGIRFELCSR